MMHQQAGTVDQALVVEVCLEAPTVGFGDFLWVEILGMWYKAVVFEVRVKVQYLQRGEVRSGS